jgi:hypothetical protein
LSNENFRELLKGAKPSAEKRAFLRRSLSLRVGGKNEEKQIIS